MASQLFLILIFGTGEEVQQMNKEQIDKYMQSWKEWDANLGKIKLRGEGVLPESTVISGKNRNVTEGLFVGHQKEFAVEGYYIFEAETKEEVIEAMKSCPTFEYDGNIEIREIWK